MFTTEFTELQILNCVAWRRECELDCYSGLVFSLSHLRPMILIGNPDSKIIHACRPLSKRYFAHCEPSKFRLSCNI